KRIDADLLAVRGGARGNEQVEVVETRGAERRAAGVGRLVEDVHRLSGPVVAGPRHVPARLVPQLADRLLLAEDHTDLPARRRVGESRAADAGGHDVRADVAERREAAVPLQRGEASETSARDVLEEDALDPLLGAEIEDLVERGFDQPRVRDQPRL